MRNPRNEQELKDMGFDPKSFDLVNQFNGVLKSRGLTEDEVQELKAHMSTLSNEQHATELTLLEGVIERSKKFRK